jgi:transcription elongation GreA/GreB family factor
MSSLDELVNERIKILRPRLLDVSRRNPLLNNVIAPRTAAYISIVDEKPQNIIDSFAKDQPFVISPLPPFDDDELPDEKTSEFRTAFENAKMLDDDYAAAINDIDPGDPRAFDTEATLERELKDRLREELQLPPRPITNQHRDLINHAKIHGIDPSTTLPSPDFEATDRRHEDLELQTLLLPSTLESRLRQKLFNRQRMFEEERGLQVTYLVVGYLEWMPEADSAEGKTYKSPLILVPVRLQGEKTKEGLQYIVSKRSEIVFNHLLKHKLEQDFGFDLKEIASFQEDDLKVESFFRKVENLKPPRMKTWKIKREATLGIYPFQGIDLHHDLRPEDIDFSKFSVLNELFLGGHSEAQENPMFSEEMIDTPEAEQAVPYNVLDADSSQFLALMKVAKGKNIALEGPPGSGKSQTIVNAIANTLQQGKRVLFVAQKKTALDVVFARLKPLGLDKFVLPLLNAKGNTERFYSAIADRICHPQTRNPKEIENLRKKLKRNRSKLSKYIDLLTKEVGETKLIVHEVLGLAIKHSDILEVLPTALKSVRLDFKKISTDFQLDDFENACNELDRYSHQLLDSAMKQDSPWSDSDLQDINYNKINSVMVNGDVVCDRIDELISSFDQECLGRLELLLIQCSLSELDDVMKLKKDWVSRGDENWLRFVDSADASEKQINQLLDLLRKRSSLIETHGSSYDQFWVFAHMVEGLQDLAKFFYLCGKNDISKSSVPSILSEYRADLERYDRLNNRKAIVDQICPGLSPHQIRELRNSFKDIKDKDWLYEIVTKTTLSVALDDVNRCNKQLRAAYLELNRNQSLPSARDVRYVMTVIEETGFFGRMFNREYSQAIMKSYSWIQNGSEKINRSEHVRRLKAIYSCAYELEKSNINSELLKFDAAFDKDLSIAQELLGRIRERLIGWGIGENLFGPLINEPAIDYLGSVIEKSFADKLDWDFARTAVLRIKNCIDFAGAKENSLEKVRGHCNRNNVGSIDAVKTLAIDASRFSLNESSIVRLTSDLQFSSQNQVTIQNLEDYKSILEKTASITVELKNLLLSKGGSRLGECVDRLLPSLVELDGLSNLLVAGKGLRLRNDKVQVQRSSLRSHLIDRAGFQNLLTRRNAFRDSLDGGFGNTLQLLVEEDCLHRANEFSRGCLVHCLKTIVEDQFGTKLMRNPGPTLNAARANLQELDRQLIDLASRAVSASCMRSVHPPSGIGRGRKSTFTEQSLINHQLGLKRRIPPRRLLHRAGKALTEWFPCWMMDPGSVARHIDREEVFDLVIIDEASQMAPEMSVSALMRGKQAMISGDTNQLPPTSFFSSLMRNDEDLDEDFETIEESILEISNIAFHPKHRLRWHYRSRHESLIAFSNHYIYDGDLVIFPSPIGDRKGMGVSLVRVNGTYEKGINPAEAQIMTDHVVKFMKEQPHRSLGVAVMNQSQMEQIDANVIRAADEDPEVAKYIELWASKNEGLEKFFVKNLENVQGDERDVIFIGTVYGESPLGKFEQRLGPINGSAGKRRLNVLFTRAKEQMVTFTSIPLAKFKPKATNEGARLLKLWLEYCHTKKLGEKITQSDVGGIPDSPFEEHVISVVEQLGFIAVPQVGVSNYHIDIGVKHLDYPMGFLCGIECDGASYHSSKSARDRDRLRQEVLEGLGWELYRIWSTDWFYDTFGQTEILKDYLHNLLQKKLEELPESVLPGEFEADSSVQVASDSIVESGSSEIESDQISSETIEGLSHQDESITVGCRVVVMDLNGARAGNTRAYWISDQVDEEGRPYPAYDLMKPYAPLALVLLGSFVGEIVSYEAGEKMYRVEVVSYEFD